MMLFNIPAIEYRYSHLVKVESLAVQLQEAQQQGTEIRVLMASRKWNVLLKDTTVLL
jgi:hypothetical protein